MEEKLDRVSAVQKAHFALIIIAFVQNIQFKL